MFPKTWKILAAFAALTALQTSALRAEDDRVRYKCYFVLRCDYPDGGCGLSGRRQNVLVRHILSEAKVNGGKVVNLNGPGVLLVQDNTQSSHVAFKPGVMPITSVFTGACLSQ